VSGQGGTTFAFASSRRQFEGVVSFLGTHVAMALEPGALEERLDQESRGAVCHERKVMTM
jgi:hypothetical protein